jgi:NAD(P)-dependent dehydrogenase (short-subunit alcohol dehydrogenase family)
MTILVTGAASGIGAALLARLGSAATGLDRTSAAITCDLSDAAALATLPDRLPPMLDGIAHVAGLPGTAPAPAILAVNLFAPVLLTEILLPRLRSGAAIIAVSSVTAARCDWPVERLDALIDGDSALRDGAQALPGVRAYELSKAALNRWVVRQAAALRAQGVRVVAVSPGPVETPILDDFRASIGADRIAAAAAMVGRHARPDDIASVIAFLLGDGAAWINGTDVRVDGGYHAVRAVEG